MSLRNATAIAIALLTTSQAIAHADHPGPTYEHECQHPNGNTDGTPCLWTNPTNGLKYWEFSETYRTEWWQQ